VHQLSGAIVNSDDDDDDDWPQNFFSKLSSPHVAYGSLCAYALNDDGADTLSSTLFII